jgi:hypothetical protein
MVQQRKKREKKGKGLMVDMRKEDTKQVGEKTRDGLVCNNDILQNFFHYDLLWSYEFLHVVLFCLLFVSVIGGVL